MKRLNILILNWRDIKHPEAGGVEIRLHELSRRLVKDGNKVTFLCSKFKNAKHYDNIDGINIIRIGRKYTFSISALFYYLFKLKHNNYDLVIEDLDKTPFFTPLYVKKPLLACYSQLNNEIYFKELCFPFSLIAFVMERVFMPLSYRNNVFMVSSKSTKDELNKLGIKQKNIFVVNDGFTPKAYKPTSLSKKKNNQILVLSRLKKYKGIHHLVLAMRTVLEKLPKTKLCIAGKGDYEKNLKWLVKKLDLEKSILFLGFVSEKKKVKLLQQSALLINPSFKEGWGINVIEANTCGTPVVASNVSGLKDSIIHEKTGVLVPYGDEAAIAKTIIKLLGDDNLRKKMGKNAIIHARKYGWDISYKQFLSCIKLFF
nr:glycosyltransferase family 4 protein [Nanoarchaeota archaeon]